MFAPQARGSCLRPSPWTCTHQTRWGVLYARCLIFLALALSAICGAIVKGWANGCLRCSAQASFPRCAAVGWCPQNMALLERVAQQRMMGGRVNLQQGAVSAKVKSPSQILVMNYWFLCNDNSFFHATGILTCCVPSPPACHQPRGKGTPQWMQVYDPHGNPSGRLLPDTSSKKVCAVHTSGRFANRNMLSQAHERLQRLLFVSFLL